MRVKIFLVFLIMLFVISCNSTKKSLEIEAKTNYFDSSESKIADNKQPIEVKAIISRNDDSKVFISAISSIEKTSIIQS